MKMRFVTVLGLIGLGLASCASAQYMFAKGISAAMGMNQKFDDLSSERIKITLATYNRPRPLSADEMDGIKATSTTNFSKVTFYSPGGDKYGQFNGTFDANGVPFVEQANGAFVALDSIPAPGQDVTITFKATSGKETAFKQAYNVETLSIVKPEKDASVDITNGFTVEWTKGTDPTKLVRIGMVVSLGSGYPAVCPIALFQDTGKATITKQMLLDFLTNGGPYAGVENSMIMGANTLVVERFTDDTKADLNGHLLVSTLAGDCVPVTLSGTIPQAPEAGYAKEYANGKVKLTVAPRFTSTVQVPYESRPVEAIHTVALASLEFSGDTGYRENDTFYYWTPDQALLEPVTNAMADLYTKTVADVFGSAQILPSEKLKANPNYSKFFTPAEFTLDVNSYDTSYLKSYFYTPTQGLGRNPEETRNQSLVPLPYRDLNGDLFLNLAKSSGADLFLFGSVYINREPEGGDAGLYTFTVSVRMYGYFFPMKNTAQVFHLPDASASWTTDAIAFKNLTVGAFLEKLGYQDFLKSYKACLVEMKSQS